MNDNLHKTVLHQELVDCLALQPGDTAIDCTMGYGGHTSLILSKVGASGKVFAIDRDQDAIDFCTAKFKQEIENNNLKIIKSSFGDIGHIAKSEGIFKSINGICADLGVSSVQLDRAEKGFSFSKDGPLDMRMDQSSNSSNRTAADFVNQEDEETMIEVFRTYGEEPQARRIAKAIIKARTERPFATTVQLANCVAGAMNYQSASRKHPATKVFQAIRIAINEELEQLKQLITDGFNSLKIGGRLGLISFHSLEDRIIKHSFLDLTGRGTKAPPPREAPLTDEQARKMRCIQGRIVKPFPLVPSDEEILSNPRARSAKLRVVERTDMLN
jgi:16S rRNA (cytosine1402-N4)-methyltransferase